MDWLALFVDPVVKAAFGWIDEQNVSPEEQAQLDQQREQYQANLDAQLQAAQDAQRAQVQTMLIGAVALVAAVWIWSNSTGKG